MEARGATGGLRRGAGATVPTWLLGLLPLALIAATLGGYVLAGTPGLGDRLGPAVEELSVERTVLEPGVIELTVRNDGPDPVMVSQVMVNGAFADFTGGGREIGRLAGERLRIQQPWIEGERYEIALLTGTGVTITHEIPAAVETPAPDAGFLGLMGLLGVYVGVIPIALGMLWLPWVRRIPPRWIQGVMALTVGLLGFLVIDATLQGLNIAAAGAQVFGGAALVLLGGVVAYLVLTGVGAWLADRQDGDPSALSVTGGKDRSAHLRAGAGSAAGIRARMALLVAVGIGLHNLGEGLAIGSAYAAGTLALGAFLVAGFALHNTTEGLAIVAPVAAARPSLRRLSALGLVAGGPAVIGACLGAAAFNSTVAAFLFGVGAGAIVQVITQLVPSIRDARGRTLHPVAVAGVLSGLALMFLTSLLVAV
jgi:zinc transporter ZupT